jgi:hypothetical protein
VGPVKAKWSARCSSAGGRVEFLDQTIAISDRDFGRENMTAPESEKPSVFSRKLCAEVVAQAEKDLRVVVGAR